MGTINNSSNLIFFRLVKIYSWFWRFNTLKLANRIYKNIEKGQKLPLNLYGYKMMLDVSRANPQKLLFLEGSRYIKENIILKPLLSRGMVVIDVGANIGYYLLLFQSIVKSEGEIMCFEPEPDNFNELSLNNDLNNFKNVQLYPYAVGNKIGYINISRGINAKIVESKNISLKVPIIKLDEFINRKVDLLKIDVEGYELEVLNGSFNLISKYKPILFIEIHPYVNNVAISLECTIKELKRYYKKISYYEVNKNMEVFSLFKKKYFNKNVINKIMSEHNLFNQCHNGKRLNTFWLVCAN